MYSTFPLSYATSCPSRGFLVSLQRMDENYEALEKVSVAQGLGNEQDVSIEKGRISEAGQTEPLSSEGAL